MRTTAGSEMALEKPLVARQPGLLATAVYPQHAVDSHLSRSLSSKTAVSPRHPMGTTGGYDMASEKQLVAPRAVGRCRVVSYQPDSPVHEAGSHTACARRVGGTVVSPHHEAEPHVASARLANCPGLSPHHMMGTIAG